MTLHGLRRIQERFGYVKSALELTRKFLNEGTPPSESFVPDKASRPIGFNDFAYKEIQNDVFIFGLNHVGKKAHLLTVYVPREVYNKSRNDTSGLQFHLPGGRISI